MLDGLYRFYKYFPKATLGLKNAASSDEEAFGKAGNVVKPKRVKGTRWVAFMLRALEVPQKHFKLLVFHLQQQGDVRNSDGRGKRAPKAAGLVRQLTDVNLLLFSYCLTAILQVLERLSLSYQQQNANPASAHKAVKTCLASLEKLLTSGFEKANEVRAALTPGDGTNLYYNGTQLNQGTRTRMQQYLGAGTGDNLDKPFNEARQLTAKLIEVIKRRYNSTEDSLIKAYRQLNTNWAVNGVPREAQFGHADMKHIVQHYRALLEKKGFDFDGYLREWDEVVLYIADLKELDPQLADLQVWKAVLIEGKRDGGKWKNIQYLIKIMLVHPVHTSDNERGYSLAKRYKREVRAKLKVSTVSAMMTVKLLGPGYDAYSPTKHARLFLAEATRRQYNGRKYAGADDGDSSGSISSSDYDSDGNTYL
jgi:hypothetical protein